MSALLLSSQYLWTRNKKSVFSYQRSTPCFFLMLTRCTENWKRTQTFLRGCNFYLLSLWNCSFSSQMQLWCAFHWQKKKTTEQQQKKNNRKSYSSFLYRKCHCFFCSKECNIKQYYWRPLKTTFLFQIWNCCFKT